MSLDERIHIQLMKMIMDECINVIHKISINFDINGID
jgi:hypothetical protein